MTTLVAQLTDTHILDPASDEERWVDNNGRLAQAVASLNAESPRPDLVVATGDLTNGAKAAETDELVRLLEPLEVPLLVLPGNHDERPLIRAAFDMPWDDDVHLSWSVEVGPITIVGLDTAVPGAEHGEFDADREAWLRRALAEAAPRPTVVAMHHPPFASGIGWMDRSRLRRSDAFADTIAANPHVTRVLCGHLHRPIQTTVGGVSCSVGLSTVHHVALDLSPTARVELIRDPAGYQLHHLADGSWVTHTRYIDTGEVPLTPSWAAGS
ncbi:MAG: phosphodiesterase [Acidimicrobiales bacterium]